MTEEFLKKLNPHLIFSGYINRLNIDNRLLKYPERVVKWYELEFIDWGEGFIDTNGIKIPATQNTLFFRYPGMKVQGYLPYSSYLLVFDAFYDAKKKEEYFEENFISTTVNNDYSHNRLEIFSSFQYSFEADKNSSVRNHFNEIHGLYTSDRDKNELYIKILILKIIYEFEKALTENVRHEKSGKNKFYIEKIEEMRKQIESNPARRYTLRQLASFVNLSPNFLCKLFTDIYGIPVFKYINSCRINISKMHLSETSLSISQIAQDCGFENESYFYRVFKKQTGLTPNEFRKISNVFHWED